MSALRPLPPIKCSWQSLHASLTLRDQSKPFTPLHYLIIVIVYHHVHDHRYESCDNLHKLRHTFQFPSKQTQRHTFLEHGKHCLPFYILEDDQTQGHSVEIYHHSQHSQRLPYIDVKLAGNQMLTTYTYSIPPDIID